ncbi:unnamed protein product [Linum trigynum]|uniref:Exonuclease 1 n=1 Tax=Linum trigynum TaxID=586398 RepID=A0AAV2CDM0_9ROSI
MGIKDLLRFMKPYIEPIHIKKYAGKRVGIDAYCWLHKGAYSCSMEICLDSNSQRKFRYLDYFMHRINLLIYHNIIPVVVLDGANIPCKAATEHERRRKREANHKLAISKLKEGNATAALEYFQRAVNITPSMANQLIQILKSKQIEFVVAPYEADAQLAYLSSLGEERGGVAAVITEDSDLLAYGCQATIFKMDQNGNGDELVLDGVFDPAVSRKPSFQHFTKELFTGMCVLAGCDFLSSVPGIGIVKAHIIVSKYRNLDRVLSVLKLEKGSKMPEDYIKSFKESLAVFQHARIYDGKTKSMKHMNPISQALIELFSGKMDFLGPEVPSLVATAIAEGNLNPLNLESFDCLPSPSSQSVTGVLTNTCKPNKSEGVTSFRRKCSFVDAQVLETINEKENIGESKCLKEALALYRIGVPSETLKETESAVAPDEVSVPLKVPSNPFKIKTAAEEIVSKDLQLQEKTLSTCISYYEDIIPEGTPEVTLSKKRKQLDLDSCCKSLTAEQTSEVIELQISESFDYKQSQESVNSKHTEVFSGGKGRLQNRKKKSTTTDSGRSSASTILNFFSRV